MLPQKNMGQTFTCGRRQVKHTEMDDVLIRVLRGEGRMFPEKDEALVLEESMRDSVNNVMEALQRIDEIKKTKNAEDHRKQVVNGVLQQIRDSYNQQ